MTIGPRVVGVQAGPVREERFGAVRMTTAICKQACTGRVQVGFDGIQGDQQADLRHHGGPSRALCCYVREHQLRWADEWGRPVPAGEFGENLTLSGLDETTVHIGDRHRIGSVLLEVASARGPCATLAARVGDPEVVQKVRALGWTGWYCRVLQPGELGPEMPLEVEYRHPAALSVAEAYRIKRRKGAGPEQLRRLLSVEALCPDWQATIRARLEASPRRT